MKNIDDFLNAVAKVSGNDNRTANFLGIANAHVGNWRGRRSMPSNRHILALCDYAKLDVETAIRAIEYSRHNERPLKEAGFASFKMVGTLGGMSLTFVTGYALYPSIGAALGAGTLYIM